VSPDIVREKMLRMIPSRQNHHAFNRVVPRMVNRDRRRYPYLNQPGAVAREKCLT